MYAYIRVGVVICVCDRLSFDSKEMAAESEMFVSQEIAKGWRRRKQDITRLLHLPR